MGDGRSRLINTEFEDVILGVCGSKHANPIVISFSVPSGTLCYAYGRIEVREPKVKSSLAEKRVLEKDTISRTCLGSQAPLAVSP